MEFFLPTFNMSNHNSNGHPSQASNQSSIKKWSVIKLSVGCGILATSLYLGYKAGRSNAQYQQEQRQNQHTLQLRQQLLQQYNRGSLPQYSGNEFEVNSLLDLVHLAPWRSGQGGRDFISPAAKRALTKTFGYLVSGLGLTIGGMYLIRRHDLFSEGQYHSAGYQFLAGAGSFIGALGAKLIPSTYNATKHAFWLLFCASNAAALVPITAVSTPILIKSAIIGTGITLGCSLLAIVVRKRSLLWLYSPLVIGSCIILGSGVFDLLSSVNPRFNDPTISSLNHSLNLYGGLILFSGYMVVDTHRIIEEAEEKEEILASRQLIRASVAVLDHLEGQPQNHNNINEANTAPNRNNNAAPSNSQSREFPGFGYRLGSASLSTQSSQNNNNGNNDPEIEHNNNSNPLINPPPYNPMVVAVDQQNNGNSDRLNNINFTENQSGPFDYDYPVKPGDNNVITESKQREEDLDADVRVDPLSWSIDFYLDFINITVRVLESFLDNGSSRSSGSNNNNNNSSSSSSGDSSSGSRAQ
jgi:FtsH-binding integral membrane protein